MHLTMFDRLVLLFLLSCGLIGYDLFISSEGTTTFYGVTINLCLSFIASFIFYLINIHLPERRKYDTAALVITYGIEKIRHNFSEFKRAFNFEISENGHAALTELIERGATPIFSTYFTDGCSTFFGTALDSTPQFSHSDCEVINRYMFLISNPANPTPTQHSLGTPRDSIEILLHGTHKIIEDVFATTEVIHPLDKRLLTKINTVIPKELQQDSALGIKKRSNDLTANELATTTIELLSRIEVFLNEPRIKKARAKWAIENNESAQDILSLQHTALIRDISEKVTLLEDVMRKCNLHVSNY